MAQIPSITDALRSVVTSTDTALQANSSLNFGTQPKRLFFMHGHPKEIVQVLQEMTNAPATKGLKYPLFALFRDVPETLNENANGIGTEFQARFIIAVLTQKQYRADDRETHSFKAILHPILEEFLSQLQMSSIFGMPSIKQLKIKKYDRYYWGRQEADKNLLNDYIDAVEVESISLKIVNNIC